MFIIEATSSQDINAAIRSVFAKHRVPIRELKGRQLSIQSSLWRVDTDTVSEKQSTDLRADLQMISGVLRITPPTEQPSPILEQLLPLSVTESLEQMPAPYQCGPPIDDDRLFYGMGVELATLHSFFSTEAEGQFVIVSAPMRSGKTSLVKQFLRSLSFQPHIGLYNFPPRAGWGVAAAVLRDHLQALTVESRSTAEPASLQNVLADLRSRFRIPVVIALDEIAGVLHGSTDDEINAFEDFQTSVRAMSGVLVVLIAPTVAMSRLDPRVVRLLQGCHTVHVGPLTKSEVRAAVTAEKLRPVYSIDLSGALARSIATDTAGNPFWVISLANEMFQLARAQKAREIAYTFDLLQAAKQNLFYRSSVFNDRFGTQVFDRTSGALKRSVLHSLAEAREWMSIGELAAIHDLPASVIHDCVSELGLAGSLKQAQGRWSIAAPLLTEYIRFSGGLM